MNDLKLTDALASIEASGVKEKTDALADLRHILRHNQGSSKLGSLKDSSFHKIFDSLFRFTLGERTAYQKSTANTPKAEARLLKCAATLRVAVEVGVRNIRTKSVKALVDHILDTLVDSDGNYLPPLTSDYPKCLSMVLAFEPHAEHLTLDRWKDVTSFCLDRIQSAVDTDDVLGSSILSVRSSHSRVPASHASASNSALPSSAVDDFVNCLRSLTSVSHASLLNHASQIFSTMVSYLNSSKSVGEPQLDALVVINNTLIQTRTENLRLTRQFAYEALILAKNLWNSKLLAVKDEVMSMLVLLQPYIENIVKGDENEAFLMELGNLVESLKGEYSRRAARDQLHLSHLSLRFSSETFPVELQTRLFSLRDGLKSGTNVPSPEHNWTLLRLLALFLVQSSSSSQGSSKRSDSPSAGPQKRRRFAHWSDDLLRMLSDSGIPTRICSLQLVCFVAQTSLVDEETMERLVERIATCINDDNSGIANWAQISLASCASQLSAQAESLVKHWKSIWQLATRAVNPSPTCRASSHLLHTMLLVRLVDQRALVDISDTMLSSVSVNGPTVFCDSVSSFLGSVVAGLQRENSSLFVKRSEEVLTWLFRVWAPSNFTDKLFAAQNTNTNMNDILNLINVCLGLPLEKEPIQRLRVWRSVAQTWILHEQSRDLVGYLLLQEKTDSFQTEFDELQDHSEPSFTHNIAQGSLVLGLCATEINRALEKWDNTKDQGIGQMDENMIRMVTLLVMVGLCLGKCLLTKDNHRVAQVCSAGQNLLGLIFRDLSSQSSDQNKVDTVIHLVAHYMVPPGSGSLEGHDHKTHMCMSELSSQMLKLLEARREMSQSTSLVQNNDLDDFMELDTDLDSQVTSRNSQSNEEILPRKVVSSSHSHAAQRAGVTIYCKLLHTSRISSGGGDNSNHMKAFIDGIIGLSIPDILASRPILAALPHYGVQLSAKEFEPLLEFFADNTLQSYEYDRAEINTALLLDLMRSFSHTWTDPSDHDLYTFGLDMYKWFTVTAMNGKLLSAAVQKRLVQLLLRVLHSDAEYGQSDGLEHVRNTVFRVVRERNLDVKHFLAENISSIFNLYSLTAHESIFEDLRDDLPIDSQWVEGIAIRVLFLANLASKWHSLLRRCIFHIFETAGKIKSSEPYATRCIYTVSESLRVKSAREVFKLFSPQLLFTWLENETMEIVPFSVFGYENMSMLLQDNIEEIYSQLVMRTRDQEIQWAVQSLQLTEEQILHATFSKAFAYAISWDICKGQSSDQSQSTSCEARIRSLFKTSGEYFKMVRSHFPYIVAQIFVSVHQEESVEKSLEKRSNYGYARSALVAMKQNGSMEKDLPPSQQPHFRGRYLIDQLERTYRRTGIKDVENFAKVLDVSSLTVILRSLVDSIHPAYGPLHTCQIVRKLRVLIALAGDIVFQGYPLQLLIRTLQPIVVDPHCSDDAIGVLRYLLERGKEFLKQEMSMFTGTSLMTILALKKFMTSRQDKTTQESQFRSTVSKVQAFHDWLVDYLLQYTSVFGDEKQRSSFSSLVIACRDLEPPGTMDKDDPTSAMLKELFDDEETHCPVLDPLERSQVISMLCSQIETSDTTSRDVLDTDSLAVSYARRVWTSTQTLSVGDGYRVWAAKALGRAYGSTVSLEFIRPTQGIISNLLDGNDGKGQSKRAIVSKLKELLSSNNPKHVGVAENSLRKIYCHFVNHNDRNSAVEFEQLLPSHVASAVAAAYGKDQTISGGSQKGATTRSGRTELFGATKLDHGAPFRTWVQILIISICRWSSDDAFISSLSDLFHLVEESAQDLFPFILHLALASDYDGEQVVRTYISESLNSHFQDHGADTDRKSRLMLETLLYLVTQPIPAERTRMGRLLWLEVDYLVAAQAAARCNMPTAALYLGELGAVPDNGSRPSRRSSVDTTPANMPSNELLLAVYSSVDDPDSFYGVKQPPSLDSVLSRVHHEGDGLKGMMLHSARMDASLRQPGQLDESDSFGMINSMGVMNLNSLTLELLNRKRGKSNFATTDTMLEAARKLEQWDIAPLQNNDSVTSMLYSVFRSLSAASTLDGLKANLHETLKQSIQRLQDPRLDASTARAVLSGVAVLNEVDELTTIRCAADLSGLWEVMRTRQESWDIGRFNDAKDIVSCRETLFSLLSQNTRLREALHVSMRDCRAIEARAVISSSQFARKNDLIQQSLTAATYLSQLVPKCQEVNIDMDAAAQFEVASTLWSQGETSSSVQMLQVLCSRQDLSTQAIDIGRSGILAQLGHEVAEARLEKPDEVIVNYLRPAIEQLNKATSGSEAGRVYFEFASFCDQQLQNPGNIEDFQRLTKLRERKAAEIEQWDAALKTAPKEAKNQMKRGKMTAQRWFQLDDQEYQKTLESRDEFVQQSLQNYLRALEVSDEFNASAVRFFALWLEHSNSASANMVVDKHLPSVPSWKFADLMNQETSRLQNDSSVFQRSLSSLITRICIEHPYHGLQQIFASINGSVNNEAGESRRKSAFAIAKVLHKDQRIGKLCRKIFTASDLYHKLADVKIEVKQGAKLTLSSVKPAADLDRGVRELGVPPATLTVDLRPSGDYSDIPLIAHFKKDIRIAGGLSAPKILVAFGSDGKEYKQLFKGGNDDLRQDAIMEQVFAEVSKMLRNHKSCRRRNLHVRTYKVLPLTSKTGVIEFVPNSLPLAEFLVPAHSKYHPSDLRTDKAREKIRNAQDMPKESRYKTYKEVAAKHQPVLRHFFFERFEDPDDWFQKRLNYTRSTATISILGHILGLGDRHCQNILLDEKSGEAIHIDLGVAFEAGRILPVPEVVPFRLTRDIVDGMGITKTEGVFRRCCEFSMEALRDEKDGIMTLLNVLRYDPLYNWTVSSVKARRMQDAGQETGLDVASKRAEDEAGEAARALAIVEKKLSKTLSTAATVNELIQQATDERNLAVLFAGWAPYA